MEVGRDAVMSASGRGDGASDGDALGMAGNTQGADRGQQTVNKRTRSEHTLVSVAGGLGHVEVTGNGELIGKGH